MAAKSTWSVLDTKEAHEQAMYELIKRDKNHACVVMWSVMNRAGFRRTGCAGYFEHIFDYSRNLIRRTVPLLYVNFKFGVDKISVPIW